MVMGMNRGKTLKQVKPKRAAAKARRAKPAAKAKPVVRVQTRTVEVDKNASLRQLAQRIVDLTVANNDEGALALYADTVESREAASPPSYGIDAIKQKLIGWRSMISDAAFLPRSVVADGNTIVIEWDGKVTLAASGRVVDLNEIAVHEIENGKIVRERYYYDPSLLQP
jgi:ketosteroid isomerase-like protein